VSCAKVYFHALSSALNLSFVSSSSPRLPISISRLFFLSTYGEPVCLRIHEPCSVLCARQLLGLASSSTYVSLDLDHSVLSTTQTTPFTIFTATDPPAHETEARSVQCCFKQWPRVMELRFVLPLRHIRANADANATPTSPR
jgi:hypothetical protein